MERLVTIRVKDGLHARPATQFAKLAKTFVADVEVRREGRPPAKAQSVVKLMRRGHPGPLRLLRDQVRRGRQQAQTWRRTGRRPDHRRVDRGRARRGVRRCRRDRHPGGAGRHHGRACSGDGAIGRLRACRGRLYPGPGRRRAWRDPRPGSIVARPCRRRPRHRAAWLHPGG